LPSCEFNCKVGEIKEDKTNHAKSPVVKDGAIIYNGIQLSSVKIKISKAYLVFENGERVPGNNFVDFERPVKLLLIIDSGWVIQNSKAWLGASEKVVTEDGKTMLDEKDLFIAYREGISAEDSKIIGLTYTLEVKQGTPPASFTVFFKVWDKKGEGYIEGNYKMFSK